jgi:hypothetical protein
LVELHVRVELWPAVTVAGFALRETVGVGAVDGEVDSEPVPAARSPLQPEKAAIRMTELSKASFRFATRETSREKMPKFTQ